MLSYNVQNVQFANISVLVFRVKHSLLIYLYHKHLERVMYQYIYKLTDVLLLSHCEHGMRINVLETAGRYFNFNANLSALKMSVFPFPIKKRITHC